MDPKEYKYGLPEELIGQKAIEPRDSCKLLVVDRKTKRLSHKIFSGLLDILDKNSVLVLNDTKVFPARLYGTKETGGRTEVLLLRQTSLDSFRALGKGKLMSGSAISFAEDFSGKVASVNDEGIEIKFNKRGTDLIEAIDKYGKTPLPPYIHSKEKEGRLRKQYQTVYAEEKGSAAAPTAGMHFTGELLKELSNRGVEIEKVTLHVGLGTFKPVTDEQIKNKTLHSEAYFLTDEVADRLNEAKKRNKKIVAVGTTTCRVLETLSDEKGTIHGGQGETKLFIQPGYKFKFVDGLITNFHLPSTSLLMLVSAFTIYPNTKEKFNGFANSLIGKAYAQAIKRKYLFFSFGDAMLIL